MARYFWRVILIGVMFLPWSLLAKAAPIEEGVVDEVRGQVTVKTVENKPRIIGPGVFLWSGDIVETGKDGFLRIIMNDGTLLELREKTRIQICDSRTTKSGNPGVVVFLGRVWSWVAKNPAGGHSFEAHTPTAVAGVRGTEFSLAVGLDGSTRVGVEEGEVVLEGNSEEATVIANQERTVEWDGPKPARPYQRGEENWQKWGRERQRFLVQNADRILPWLLADVKKNREKLRELRQEGQEKFKALQEKIQERKAEGKKVRLTPEERREIADFLAQVLLAVHQLQRADHRMMAKYYLLLAISEDTKENPQDYTPEFRATLEKILADLERLDIPKIHEDNVKIIDGYTTAIDNIATRLKLWPLLKRRVVANRRAALEEARKNYHQHPRRQRER